RFDEMVWLQAQRIPNTEVATCMGVTEGTVRRWEGKLSDWMKALYDLDIITRLQDRIRDRKRGVLVFDVDDPTLAESAPILFEWDKHHEEIDEFSLYEQESALREWFEDAVRCELMMSEYDALRN
ncbi:MAG: hypothetical protein KDA52_13660, partial [Planctomycetaceae bacterium]|nr:hypothetical protein [Planctomycetaceae bacterium]